MMCINFNYIGFIDYSTSDYDDLAKDHYNSSLVVIDSRLEDIETLVNGLKSNATSLVIDSKDINTIARITQALTETPVTSLHLVGHGSPGYLELGSTPLTTENLVEYQQYLRQWQVEEILIYGCCMAQDEDFLKRLQIFTGARVAGSKVPVGNTEKERSTCHSL